MILNVCVNVPPLDDEPFITTAFIRPGLLIDRWELCVMERKDCIRAAATFHFKPDLPLVPLHLPHTNPLLIHHWHSGVQTCLATPLSQANNQSATQAVAAPAPHYSKGLSPPIFSHFWVRPPHFLSASVYPISHNANPPASFLMMNDRWPSHWQLGSWCYIITVSPFRQNYQITPVLKRSGRLTGQPTKKIQISEKRRTERTTWAFTDEHQN